MYKEIIHLAKKWMISFYFFVQFDSAKFKIKLYNHRHVVWIIASEQMQEERIMGLAERLKEELNCNIVFEPEIFGIKIHIYESVVIMWGIMAVLILASFLMTRGLKVHNIGKRQAAVELIVTKLQNIVKDMVGHEGVAYAPYLVTVLIFISISNISGVFGFKSPTKDVCVTAALAVMSIILANAAGIYHLGVKKWLHKFIEPIGVVGPIKVLELFTKPLSLCMRLFGNVLGAFVVMELIKIVVPIFIPAVFSLYFEFFDGILQAYVFTFLTSLYIKEAIE